MKIKIIDELTYEYNDNMGEDYDIDISEDDLKEIGITKKINLKTKKLEPYINTYLLIKPLKKELFDLLIWFDEYFEKQKSQHDWQDDYTPSYDSKFEIQYKNFDEVKIKANEIRGRIKELQKQIDNVDKNN